MYWFTEEIQFIQDTGKLGSETPFSYLSGSSWCFSPLRLPIPQSWKVKIWSPSSVSFWGCVCVSSNCSPAPFPLRVLRMTCLDDQDDQTWPLGHFSSSDLKQQSGWLSFVCGLAFLGQSLSEIWEAMTTQTGSWVQTLPDTIPRWFQALGMGARGPKLRHDLLRSGNPETEVGLARCPGSLKTLSVSALIELRKSVIPRKM